MKKICKIFIAIALVAITTFSLIACTAKIDGTYTPYSMSGKIMGMNVSIVFDELTEEESVMYETFKTMKIVIEGEELIQYTDDVEQERNTFRREEDKLIPLDADGNDEVMDVDGATATITVDGKDLIMEMSMTGTYSMSIKLVFKKVVEK